MSNRSTAKQQPARVQQRRRVAITAVLGAAALAAVSVFVVQSGGGGGSALPPVEVETGVIHVHGLGVDPGDGVLYAATHSGLFRVPEQGRASRVANREQDTMGFSIVGPGKFMALRPDPWVMK